MTHLSAGYPSRYPVPLTDASRRASTPVLPSLALPPIATLPSSLPAPDVLRDFVRRRGRGWASVAVPLSPAVTGALWILFALNMAFGGYLLAARSGVVGCSGTPCQIATLGDHAGLTLTLAALCVGALLALTPTTGWLTRAGGPQIAVAVLAGLCGVIALAGVVALVLFVALLLSVALGLLVAVVVRR